MIKNKTNLENSTKISKQISELMLEKKALDIRIIDVREITTLTDYFIVCSSDSDPQTRAICHHIEDELTNDGIKPWHIEGMENLSWVLIDYVNIVVQIFSIDSREFYDLERLWADGKITKVTDK